jgi:chromosome segregation protein
VLSRIEIRGFKSFPAPIVLDLGPGVNVVVGPNGSGKSNIVEAVLWGMGEQRATRLRASGGWQDVIFSGSPMRPPSGLAEVALLLAPEDGEGPAELEVSRRLTRAGETYYRLNGETCRLIDLHDALSGRGLGSESFAVIRQGQVEAICASRPAELRAILDEAAGIGLPKRRRRRAEQKIARTADKLDRARDIAGEVASRARALERQARAAERAAAIEEELAGARTRLAAVRAVAAHRALADAVAQSEQAARGASEATHARDEVRARRATAESERSRAVEELSSAEALALTLRAGAERLSGRAELAADRVDEAVERADRRSASRRSAGDRLADLERELADRSRAAEEAETEAASAAGVARRMEEEDIEARTAERTGRDALAGARAAVAEAERAAVEAGRRVDRIAAEMQRVERQAVASGAGEPVDLSRTERRATISSARAERHREVADRAARALADASATLEATEIRRREAHTAAQVLAPADGADVPGAGNALGDGLEVEPGLERAVAAALGALADATLAGGVRQAREAVEAGASAALVPAPSREAGTAPARATPLRSAVRACAPDARPHIERLLADAWLLESLDGIPSGSSGVFVTRDGIALRPDQGIVSASRSTWGRRALHRRAVEAEQAARADVEAARGAVERARAAEARARRRQAAAERCSVRAAERLSTERARAERVAAENERRHAELEAAHAAMGPAREEAERAAAELGAARLAAQEAEAAHVRARQRAAESEMAHRRAAAALVDAGTRAAELRGTATAVAERLAQVRAEAEAPEARPLDLDLPRRAAAVLRLAAEALGPREQASRALVAGRRAAVEERERVRAAEEEALLAAESRVEQAAAVAQEAEIARAVAAERAREAGPAPEDGDLSDVDPEAFEQQVAALERRRESIGPVNALAAAERAELSAREEELAEQITDLEESIAALRAHLAELEAAVSEGFQSVFGAVGERFSEVIGLLFPGGEGRLQLVLDEEGGDPGVEIQVVPAGKKPRSLSLLSGGERSLVALAFCLALATSRKAPFYLLDEVEAALDDVNLRRFLGVVRKLAETTQFVLVTHQQPTVEISDTLFGVTMADGVSQVVARRLAKSVEGPARPFVRRALKDLSDAPRAALVQDDLSA